MQKKGLSQESLKLVACVTMLIDHIGLALVPWWSLRCIGRIAFPIYCFLLAEGAHYTKNPKGYALRLAVGMVLSELPFDLVVAGRPSWDYQSVMVTLLLGYGALLTMKHCKTIAGKVLVCLPFALAADLLRTDYAGAGIVLIAMFGITRDLPRRWLAQLLGMAVICIWLIPSAAIDVLGFAVPVEIFALAALPFLASYQGRKASGSKAVQWAFYLFYPMHLTALYGIGRCLLW